MSGVYRRPEEKIIDTETQANQFSIRPEYPSKNTKQIVDLVQSIDWAPKIPNCTQEYGNNKEIELKYNSWDQDIPVLKKEHWVKEMAKEISDMGLEDKARIKELKKDEYQFVGYLRKLPGKEYANTRFRFMDSMVDRLTKNSSVDMVFELFSSTSKEPSADRDRSNPIHVPNTLGKRQDLLRLLSTTKKPIAIVAIDLAGLTIDTNDFCYHVHTLKSTRKAIQSILNPAMSLFPLSV
ncbi:hypothetical protein [Parasitella parasitica]|uniref:Uncharacterized protein n=1 Tax=Parasitella parasitica TaxID=35722 RepID=A0A0B7NNP2_9FUNG|nr:hypothetical protein [Parasitella parasitica]